MWICTLSKYFAKILLVPSCLEWEGLYIYWNYCIVLIQNSSLFPLPKSMVYSRCILIFFFLRLHFLHNGKWNILLHNSTPSTITWTLFGCHYKGRTLENITQKTQESRDLLPCIQTMRTTTKWWHGLWQCAVNRATNSGKSCFKLVIFLNVLDHVFWEITILRNRFFFIFHV